mgnify:FL=1
MIRRIYRGGIPCWTDGELILPEIAGGQTKPPKTSSDKPGGTGGKISLRSSKPPETIKTFKDLKEAIPDYKDRSLREIFLDITTKGLMMSPQFYKQIQDYLLAVEKTTGNTVSALTQIPASGTIIDEAEDAYSYNAKTGFPKGLGGTSGRTAAEEALTIAQTADITEQQRIERERIAEDKRQNLLNTARSLIEAKMTERATARGQAITSAGSDVFRFLAQINQQDVAADVKTPYDIFKSQLGAVASQEVPQISPNASIEDLESAIGKLQGMSELNAKYRYVQLCRSLKTYGVTFFEVRVM